MVVLDEATVTEGRSARVLVGADAAGFLSEEEYVEPLVAEVR